MPCSLRSFGKEFSPDRFKFKRSWNIEDCYRKGEPKNPLSNPAGKKNEVSGVSISVSNADFDDLPGQIADAIKFIKRNKKDLERLRKCKGVQEVAFDFGINQRQVSAQFDYFPPDLLGLLGGLGIGIELSQYEQEAQEKKVKSRKVKK